MDNKFEGPSNNLEKDNLADNPDSYYEDFFNTVKEVVLKRVSEILEKSESEMTDQEKEFYKKYVSYLTISTVASMGAGDYFSEMIPNSMSKPKKEYNHKDTFPSIIRIEEFIKEKREDFQKIDGFSDIKKDFKSEVYEKESGDEIVQIGYNRFLRDDKKVILEELVDNYLKKDYNLPLSVLMAINWDAGVKIDFEQMLPNGYSFAPSEMIKSEEDIDLEKLEKRVKYYPVNLKDYEGTKNSAGTFYQASYLKRVAYGDLAKKGGLLGLFHEIAHAWQDVYHGENNRGNFDNFYKEVSICLKILKGEQDKFRNKKIMEGRYDRSLKYINGELAKLGVEFDVDNFIYSGQDLEKGSIVITDFEGGRYVIKSDSFDDIKKNYEREERDAWAHALLMLRFLRKRGIDLEPDMKSPSDIKNYIEECLGTYQSVTEQKIEIIGGKIGFVKNPKMK